MVRRTFALNLDLNEDIIKDKLWAVQGEEGSTALLIIPVLDGSPLPIEYALQLKCVRKDGVEELVDIVESIAVIPDTMYAKSGIVKMLVVAESVDNIIKSAPFDFNILDEI